MAAWVCIPRLSLEYFDEEFLMRIGNRIGLPLKADATTLATERENEQPEIAKSENPLPSQDVTEHPAPLRVRSQLGDDELLDQFAKDYKTPSQQPPKPSELMVAKSRCLPLRSKGDTDMDDNLVVVHNPTSSVDVKWIC
ncbi:hypothetical protein NL676_012956 [Syzygium grande]|nr:hypothetical protein NL676_012956 [Syzygium grande]